MKQNNLSLHVSHIKKTGFDQWKGVTYSYINMIFKKEREQSYDIYSDSCSTERSADLNDQSIELLKILDQPHTSVNCKQINLYHNFQFKTVNIKLFFKINYT